MEMHPFTYPLLGCHSMSLELDILPLGVFAHTVALRIRALPAARETILDECRFQS